MGLVKLAIATVLIFFAHMMTAYFFVVTAAVIIAGRFFGLFALGWPRVRAGLVRGLTFGVLVLGVIGPYAAAVTYVSEFSGVGNLGMQAHPDLWSWILFDPYLSWSRAVVEGQMSLEIGRWPLLCLSLFLLLAPAARASIWQRAGGLVVLTIWYVLLQHYGMGFWFDVLPGASKIQFPARLLVFIVNTTLLCTALATEAALRSTVPFVRVAARVLPFVAAAWQGNSIRGMQSAVWGLNVERGTADTELANMSDVLSKKVSMNTSWDVFLPRRHGNYSPEQPFLVASEGCKISSPTLTKGLAVQRVDKNVAGSISFTVLGKNCTVKVDQIQSFLLKVELSKAGGARQTDDGLILVDAPTDGTVVRIHERSVLDLARKFMIEKSRRLP